jgi:hypothetical protein
MESETLNLNEDDTFLENWPNLDTYSQDLLGKLLNATKSTTELPDADSYKYYLGYPPFKSKMNDIGRRLLGLTQGFLQFEKGNKVPVLSTMPDAEDAEDQFELVTDIIDNLIEKVVRLWSN